MSIIACAGCLYTSRSQLRCELFTLLSLVWEVVKAKSVAVLRLTPQHNLLPWHDIDTQASAKRASLEVAYKSWPQPFGIFY